MSKTPPRGVYEMDQDWLSSPDYFDALKLQQEYDARNAARVSAQSKYRQRDPAVRSREADNAQYLKQIGDARKKLADEWRSKKAVE